MGARSRRKGQAGERELAAVLTGLGFDAHRTGQTAGWREPDVCTALAGVHIECKRTERLNLREAMGQACRDADTGAVPVVCHRSNRTPWLCTVLLSDLPRLSDAVIAVLNPNAKDTEQ